MIYFKNAIRVLFSLLICFFTACSSLDTEPGKKVRKQKRKKPEISQSARDVANIKSEAFFGESGLDFLSKKLEDTISGYRGLQEKILGLEERLSKLIFLLEAKVHAVTGEDMDDTDEDDLLIEAEEVLPYEEEEEKLSKGEKSKKKKLSKEEREKKSKTEKIPDPNENVVSKSSGE